MEDAKQHIFLLVLVHMKNNVILAALNDNTPRIEGVTLGECILIHIHIWE